MSGARGMLGGLPRGQLGRDSDLAGTLSPPVSVRLGKLRWVRSRRLTARRTQRSVAPLFWMISLTLSNPGVRLVSLDPELMPSKVPLSRSCRPRDPPLDLGVWLSSRLLILHHLCRCTNSECRMQIQNSDADSSSVGLGRGIPHFSQAPGEAAPAAGPRTMLGNKELRAASCPWRPHSPYRIG